MSYDLETLGLKTMHTVFMVLNFMLILSAAIKTEHQSMTAKHSTPRWS